MTRGPRMRGRGWKLTVSAVVTATALSACGGADGGSGSGGDAAGNLLVWVGTGTGGEAIQQVAKGYGEELGVDINVDLVPGETLQTNFVTASQGNNAPDVVCGAH